MGSRNTQHISDWQRTLHNIDGSTKGCTAATLFQVFVIAPELWQSNFWSSSWEFYSCAQQENQKAFLCYHVFGMSAVGSHLSESMRMEF